MLNPNTEFSVKVPDEEWEVSQAFGPDAAECARAAITMARVTGSVGATYSIGGPSSQGVVAPVSSATVSRKES